MGRSMPPRPGGGGISQRERTVTSAPGVSRRRTHGRAVRDSCDAPMATLHAYHDAAVTM